MTIRTCNHFDQLTEPADASSKVCDQCVAMGSKWVHLRACLHCGAVGCCDNSPNRHARKHWEETQHPLIQSVEPGETWRYCFPDHYLSK
jgi:uncharacterized UBP type Zn finger protein